MSRLDVELSDNVRLDLRVAAARAGVSMGALAAQLIHLGLIATNSETAVLKLYTNAPPAPETIDLAPPVVVLMENLEKSVNEAKRARDTKAAAHRHKAKDNGPVTTCECGAIRVNSKWQEAT